MRSGAASAVCGVRSDPRRAGHAAGRRRDLDVSTVSLTIAARLKHSRLTTFFRYILAIPLLFVNYFYAIVAYIAVIFAWFAIVITGRYPAGLYGFAAGYLRFSTRAVA